MNIKENVKEEKIESSDILDLKELENVEGGACVVACESGCLWSGKEVVRKEVTE